MIEKIQQRKPNSSRPWANFFQKPYVTTPGNGTHLCCSVDFCYLELSRL